MRVKFREFEGVLLTMAVDSYGISIDHFLHPETYTIKFQKETGEIIEARCVSEDEFEVAHG